MKKSLFFCENKYDVFLADHVRAEIKGYLHDDDLDLLPDHSFSYHRVVICFACDSYLRAYALPNGSCCRKWTLPGKGNKKVVSRENILRRMSEILLVLMDDATTRRTEIQCQRRGPRKDVNRSDSIAIKHGRLGMEYDVDECHDYESESETKCILLTLPTEEDDDE